MAVRILVNTIPSNISLAYVRVILLSGSRSGIFRWWRKRDNTAYSE